MKWTQVQATSTSQKQKLKKPESDKLNKATEQFKKDKVLERMTIDKNEKIGVEAGKAKEGDKKPKIKKNASQRRRKETKEPNSHKD